MSYDFGTMSPSWTAAEDALLGTMPDCIVAMKTGKTIAAVVKRRRKLRVQSWNTRRAPGATEPFHIRVDARTQLTTTGEGEGKDLRQ